MFLRPLSLSLALLLTTAPVFAQTAPTPPAVTPTTTPRETIEGTLSQEAMWAIRAWLETVREE